MRAKSWKLFFRGCAILPAVALGTLAMIMGGVSTSAWAQQPAAFVIFGALALLLRRVPAKIPAWVLTLLFAAAIGCTLPGQAVGGARRWIDLGVVNVNAALMLTPALIAVSCRTRYPLAGFALAAGIAAAQPDMSQLAAVIAATLPVILLPKGRTVLRAVLFSALACALVKVCLMFPVSLEPVEHCEGILGMLGTATPVPVLAGWAALILPPVCLTIGAVRRTDVIRLCLALYYAMLVVFTISGEYPVPFMGLGMSAIAGWWLAGACSAEQ